MSPTLPPLAFTRYQRSPQRSSYAARRRSGLALRLTEPTSATARGWKNSSRSARCWVTFGRSACRGLARQHREVETPREHAGRESPVGVHIGAGDVARRVAVQEDDQVRLFLGGGIAPPEGLREAVHEVLAHVRLER